MNTALIHRYCTVIKEIYTPFHAIYYKDGDQGRALLEMPDGYEDYEYLCFSLAEFYRYVEAWTD